LGSVDSVVGFIVVFGVLVTVHELGHYLVAKLTGVRVHEFSLGFGPPLWRRRRGDTEYAVRAIPLGGYVRMAGMDPEAPDGERPLDADDPRAFPNKPLWQRFVVILAGPFMNLVLAAVLYVVIFGPVGTPRPTTTVGVAMAGYPAQQAGIRAGDKVVAIDGHPVHTWNELATQIGRHVAKPIAVRVERGGATRTLVVTSRYDPTAHQRIIGIEPAYQTTHLPILAAIGSGASTTIGFAGAWFSQLGQLITGRLGLDVSGPVGIAVMVGQAVQQGWLATLLLAAALSANLGLFNVLPVPVLDGSRLWILVVEAVRRRPLDPAKEGMIHMVGFVFLVLFVLFVTYHDLLRLVG
jgi:regulator of sigma E protease